VSSFLSNIAKLKPAKRPRPLFTRRTRSPATVALAAGSGVMARDLPGCGVKRNGMLPRYDNTMRNSNSVMTINTCDLPTDQTRQ
jgi:hypothetical protein